jgi:hypothetical protein
MSAPRPVRATPQPAQNSKAQTKAPTVGAYTQELALPHPAQSVVGFTQLSAAVWQ